MRKKIRGFTIIFSRDRRRGKKKEAKKEADRKKSNPGTFFSGPGSLDTAWQGARPRLDGPSGTTGWRAQYERACAPQAAASSAAVRSVPGRLRPPPAATSRAALRTGIALDGRWQPAPGCTPAHCCSGRRRRGRAAPGRGGTRACPRSPRPLGVFLERETSRGRRRPGARKVFATHS